MVNKREQLKQEIARDLSMKIETTQQLLNKLKTAQDDVKNDCENAKKSFQKSVDELMQTLTTRKNELHKQVDVVFQKQSGSLQESIQAASIALGSLQSTLANLDSFDNGQLVNLAVPDFLWNDDDLGVSPLEVDAECTQVKDDIGSWGSVSAKGFHLLSQRNQKFDPEMEAWLCRSRSRSVSSSDEEDFEIVLQDNDRWLSREMKEDKQLLDDNTTNEDLSSGISVIQSEISETSPSPYSPDLIPAPAAIKTYSDIDLSKWLIPKRRTSQMQSSSETILADATNKQSTVVPEELSQKFASFSNSSTTGTLTERAMFPHKSHSLSSIASKREYLDFPCLRMDSKCWLQKKRSKECNENFLCADVCFTLGKKEIIPPPSYALPYPFWLKKC